ncbi:MAG TPA: UbiA family prenyltransferase, partial [Nitrosomonas nitrosa]|nr:UbiA family prenyltransferase [Nitrosomonas nitrosa]
MVDELTTKKEENATLSVNQASCRGLLPIVVDLDGTLTPTDTLIEGVISTIQQNPCSLLFLPFWLMKGKSAFKEKIAAHAEIAAEHLPYHESFLSYLRKEKEKGRSILLATATHQSIAHKVATHLGLFDGVIASDAQHNLKGKAKLAAIREKITGGFIYAGDSDADLPIWKAAQGAILVGASPSVTKVVREHIPIEQEFIREKISAVDWLRALRVHQWLKNVLLFVPMLTAFSFTDLDKMAIMVVAFFSFSFAASATYIVNDLWDLGNDRMHPRKRFRPFASAKIPILYGLVMAGGMLLLAFFMAFVVSFNFFLMLCVYLILTSAYSWTLKQYVLIDVLMLSILYTLRILAGSVA